MNDKAHWRAPELGEARDLDLPAGRVRVHERGEGPPIVFVHGFLVNSNLWRKVVSRLASDFRCVTIDMPMGAHLHPMSESADLSPPGQADLVADVIEALGLDEVTLVGNDTGGAVCQMVAAHRPERLGALALTSCDYRDNFPPPPFSYFLGPAAKVPGGVLGALAPMRIPAARRLPVAFGWVTKQAIDRPAEDSYVLPALQSKGIRRDVRRFIAGVSTKDSNAAADRLPQFGKPALVAWSAEDKLFPRSDAEALAGDLSARLEFIPNARTFSPEDQPQRVAKVLADFVREHSDARRQTPEKASAPNRG